MALGSLRVAWAAMSPVMRGKPQISPFRFPFQLRFATNTAAFAYASFPQDQQIKSNFNQANPICLRYFCLVTA
jgi:hypothetical protein